MQIPKRVLTSLLTAKRSLPYLMGAFLLLWSVSCETNDDSETVFPLTAEIFNTVNGKKVAFQGLTHSASSWSWDFGDGNTSSEQNPVHVYQDGGYYDVVFKATDAAGNVITKEVKLAIDLTPYILLTGGPTAANGKTWKLDPAHSEDWFANSDADLSVFDGLKPLPTGVFGNPLGISEVYDDTFTFHFDGNYDMDLQADGGGLSNVFYHLATSGGADILAGPNAGFPFVNATYNLDADATFTFTENDNISVASVYGLPTGFVDYNDVTTLSFSGNGYVGYRDFETRAIVRNVSDASMQLVLFVLASADFMPPNTPIPLNTHALVLTFKAVQ